METTQQLNNWFLLMQLPEFDNKLFLLEKLHPDIEVKANNMTKLHFLRGTLNYEINFLFKCR